MPACLVECFLCSLLYYSTVHTTVVLVGLCLQATTVFSHASHFGLLLGQQHFLVQQLLGASSWRNLICPAPSHFDDKRYTTVRTTIPTKHTLVKIKVLLGVHGYPCSRLRQSSNLTRSRQLNVLHYLLLRGLGTLAFPIRFGGEARF